MQKKAIEKIPFLPVAKITDRKVKFVAAADTYTLKDTPYLIVDIYENKVKCIKMPAVRICLTQYEFANWYPKGKTWDKKLLENIVVNTNSLRANNTRIAEENKVTDFCNDEWDTDWYTCIRRIEKDMNMTYRERIAKAKRDELVKRIEHMPAIPGEFYEWCETLFDHYLFYRRSGRYVTITCTACGRTETCTVEDNKYPTFENMFEKRCKKPKHGKIGTCPCCGQAGRYKSIGKCSVINEHKYVHMVQNYNKNAVVLRQFDIQRRSTSDGSEVFEDVEIIRTFISKDGEVQRDFNKYDPYRKENFWDYKNLYGMASITSKKGALYPGSLEELDKSCIRYCALREYTSWYSPGVPIDTEEYLMTYQQGPALEMLVKMKMYDLVEDIIERRGRKVNLKAQSAEGVLMIDKAKIKRLCERGGDINLLGVMQVEKNLGISIKTEYEDILAKLDLPKDDLRITLTYMNAGKLINRIFKYAGISEKDFKYGCSQIIDRAKSKARKYTDYLGMRQQMGYDLTDSIILFPRDLEREHAKMVLEVNKAAQDKRKKEVNEKYPQISENFEKLNSLYGYEDNEYMVRPAKDAAEIIDEGRTLHHCVGSDTYLNKHNTGRSVILFMRKKGDIPYITVEISATKILQWYGEYDRKPDEAKNKKWLDDYVDIIKQRINGEEYKELLAAV